MRSVFACVLVVLLGCTHGPSGPASLQGPMSAWGERGSEPAHVVMVSGAGATRFADSPHGALVRPVNAALYTGGQASNSVVPTPLQGLTDEVHTEAMTATESSNDPVLRLSPGVIYYNSSPRKLLVVANGNATSTVTHLSGFIGWGTAPLRIVASETGTDRKSLSFVVPSGYYYRVTLDGGKLNSEAWEM